MDFGNDMFAAEMTAQQMENQQFIQDQMVQQQIMQEQSMLNQQQMMSHMVMMPQIMYDRYGNPRIHKKQALELLRYNLQSTTGCCIMKETKIDEAPNLLRHCCYQCGISQLPKNEFPIPAIGVSIPYYFCKTCGSLYIYDEFM